MIEDLKKCEIYCLRTIDYKMNYYTSYHFINYFLLNGIVFSDDSMIFNSPQKDQDRRHSTSNSAYNSTAQNTNSTQRDNFSQKNLEKIYSVVKEILVCIIDGKNLI